MGTTYRGDSDEDESPDPDDQDSAPSAFADSCGAGRACPVVWDDGARCGGRLWGGACDLCGTPDPDFAQADTNPDREPTDAELDALEAEAEREAIQTEPDIVVHDPDDLLGIRGEACPHPPHRYSFILGECLACGTAQPPPACQCDSCAALRGRSEVARHAAMHLMWYRAQLRRGMSTYF